jgi:hypothetical protein
MRGIDIILKHGYYYGMNFVQLFFSLQWPVVGTIFALSLSLSLSLSIGILNRLFIFSQKLPDIRLVRIYRFFYFTGRHKCKGVLK